MTQVLASRLAGLRLGAIVAALFIPLFIILAVLVNQFNGRIERLENELNNLALSYKTLPVLMESASGVFDPATLKEAAALDLASVKSLGSSAHAEKFQALVSSPNPKPDDVLAVTQGFLEDFNARAPLGFDADNRSLALATLLANDVPALARAQYGLRTSISAMQANPAGSAAPVLALGEWRAAADRVRHSMQRYAAEASSSSARAAKFGQLATTFDASLSQTIDGIIKDPDTAHGALTGLMSGTAIKDYNSRFKSVVELATIEFSFALENRLAALQSRRLWTVLLTAVAMMLSLGAAYALFRKSLLKLDEMEATQRAASAAQVQSETMNKRLTQINSEIVHLNHELADKMRRLKDVQDELLKRGRLEQLGQLTATVAHELRNPLGAVRTSAFLLDRKIKGKGLGVEPQLQRINSGITRCDSIITQLLDFSRTKVISAQPAVFDDWLAGVLEEESKRLPAVIEIECVLGLEGIDVEFDQARMQRAMINLISNASEAMVGTGEDPSKFAVQNPKLRIVTRRDGDTMVITVSDNGPGIPPEIMEKIREPLFTTKSFGTGLGIPAVDQIANQHGGRLEVKSEVGHGAHFSIFIPLKQPEEKAA